MPDETRDEQLGDALHRLEVPPHRDDFFSDLAARLEQVEPAAPIAAPPQTRHHRSRRVRPTTVWGVAAAVVAAVLVAGVVLRPGDVPGPLGPQVASAAEVRTRVAEALSGLSTLQGEVTVECAIAFGSCYPPEEGGRTALSWTFVTTAEGNERVTGVGRLDDLAYRADDGVQRSITDQFEMVLAEEVSGLPPGPPDFAARESVLRRDVAAVVRAFLSTTSEVPVSEVTFDGRAAWHLVAEVTPNKLAGPGGSGDSLDVVVDRQTGFPLRITETLDGSFLHEVRLSGLVVDEPVDPSAFELDLPAGASPFRQDVGFRRVALEEVAATVGYQPLLPAAVPAGFELAEVTVAEEAQPTGSEAANPPSEDVVSVAYRRGFDRIVVTTRAAGPYRLASPDGTGTLAGWDDPLASGEGFLDEAEPFTVATGALAGAEAELVISPRGTPHVWTFGDDLVTTVAGDASAEDLRRMVESFSPAT